MGFDAWRNSFARRHYKQKRVFVTDIKILYLAPETLHPLRGFDCRTVQALGTRRGFDRALLRSMIVGWRMAQSAVQSHRGLSASKDCRIRHDDATEAWVFSL